MITTSQVTIHHHTGYLFHPFHPPYQHPYPLVTLKSSERLWIMTLYYIYMCVCIHSYMCMCSFISGLEENPKICRWKADLWKQVSILVLGYRKGWFSLERAFVNIVLYLKDLNQNSSVWKDVEYIWCMDVRVDHNEDWVSNNWCFWTVVLEKTLESPLDFKEMKPVHPKGNRS